MINFNAIAKVTYSATLTKSDELKVRMYADEKGVSLDIAIKELMTKKEIEIYDGTVTEEECITEKIQNAKYEEDEPEYLESWER